MTSPSPLGRTVPVTRPTFPIMRWSANPVWILVVFIVGGKDGSAGHGHGHPPGQDVIDHPVVLRLLGAHDVVAVGVLADPLDGLPGVQSEDLLHPAALAKDLLGLDLD